VDFHDDETPDSGRAPGPAEGDEPADPRFDDPGGEDVRHDGFGPAARRLFLKTLAKTGCVAEAARAAGISTRTAYNHRERDPAFADLWRLALSSAAVDIELIAWERGVTGIEEPVYAYGKFSHMRVRRNDAILLRLLEGSNPKKYGRRPSRKRILKEERRQMEREIHAEIAAKAWTFDEAIVELDKRLRFLGLRTEAGGGPGAGPEQAPDPEIS
jgi:hypothetical protein